MFQIVGVPYAEYRDLPRSEHRWLLICLSRYADETGVAFPTIRQLAVDSGFSIASVSRYLTAMEVLSVFERDRLRPGGRYRYRIAMPLRPRKFGRVSGLKHPVSQAETRVANLPKHLKKDMRFGSFDGLPPDQPWEQRVQAFRKSGFWLEVWGPQPDQPGYFAPASVMR